MKQLLKTALMVCLSSLLWAQQGYYQSYGNPKGQPLVFLHGGPGISAIDFEILMAEELAAKGFFVIIYDRNGEGRSENDEAPFTFEGAYNELNGLLDHYNLEKVALLGHSFGGILGSKYTEQFPERVSHLVLMGAPLSLQATFRTILDRVGTQAKENEDTSLKEQIDRTLSLDTASLFYSSSCFMMAMQQGMYNTTDQLEEGKLQLQRMTNSEPLKAYGDFLAKTNYKTMMQPVNGFWMNEAYTTLDITALLETLRRKGVSLMAIYGAEDGLFDEAHLRQIRRVVGEEDSILILDRCGHFPYLDRPADFTKTLSKWLQHGL